MTNRTYCNVAFVFTMVIVAIIVGLAYLTYLCLNGSNEMELRANACFGVQCEENYNNNGTCSQGECTVLVMFNKSNITTRCGQKLQYYTNEEPGHCESYCDGTVLVCEDGATHVDKLALYNRRVFKGYMFGQLLLIFVGFPICIVLYAICFKIASSVPGKSEGEPLLENAKSNTANIVATMA